MFHLNAHRRAKWLGVLLLLATGAVTSLPVHAQFVVHDPGATASRLGIFAKETAEWLKTTAHQGAQAADWALHKADRVQQLMLLQQTLADYASNPMLMMISMDDKFSKRPPNYGLINTCGSGGNFDPTMIWRDFVPNLGGDIKKQQTELCARMVFAENAQYNATVDLLQQLRARDLEMERIEIARKTRGIAPGQMATIDNEIASFAGNLQLDLDGWNATMQAYDNYIASLRTEQNRLSRVALRGQPSFFGEVIKAGTLKMALDAL